MLSRVIFFDFYVFLVMFGHLCRKTSEPSRARPCWAQPRRAGQAALSRTLTILQSLWKYFASQEACAVYVGAKTRSRICDRDECTARLCDNGLVIDSEHPTVQIGHPPWTEITISVLLWNSDVRARWATTESSKSWKPCSSFMVFILALVSSNILMFA